MKNNISKFKNCYGCGVCVIGCPVKIIDLKLNKEGFYSPKVINQEKCIECGVCLDVCAYNHDELASQPKFENIKSFGCWSKDNNIRNSSTTGGMGYEIAKEAILKGMKVCAVKYEIAEIRAEHYIADKIDSLQPAQGTKYIPSFTKSAFKIFRRDERYIVFGLPCQIDSLRRHIQRFKIENNFILIDLLCYGVPSLLLWRRYLKQEVKNIGDIKKVKFRTKINGWHKSSCIEIKGKDGEFIQPAKDSAFFGLFFTDTCLNKCCYNKCKYKLCNSSADLRIGDFWGKRYSNDDKGVNVLFSFTKKGESMIDELRKSCEFEPVSTDEACQNQKKENAKKSPLRPVVMYGLEKNFPIRPLALLSKGLRALLHPQIIIKKIFK